MTWNEIRKLSITSAERYYSYLEQEGKGIVETGINKLSAKNGFINLELAGKLFSAEDVCFKVLDKIYSSHEIKIIHYDKDNNLLRIRPHEDLNSIFIGISAQDIKIISDLKFLVKRVRDWYASCNAQLNLPASNPIISPDMPQLKLKPSDEQFAAFNGIFASPLSYIWGAPGTGKTQFVLARAVLAYYQANKRVLVAAPTNNAVEQTLTGILEVFEEAGIPLEHVIRLGTPSKSFYDRYPSVCEVRAVEDELEALNKQIAFYEKCLKFYDALSWLDHVEKVFNSNAKKIEEHRAAIAELDLQKTDLHNQLNLKQASIASIQSKVNFLTSTKSHLTAYLSKKRSFISALLHKSRINQAKIDLDNTDHDLMQYYSEYDQFFSDCNQIEQRINHINSISEQNYLELSNACSAIRNLPETQFFGSFIDITAAFFPDDDIKSKIDTAAYKLEKIRSQIMRNADQYNNTSPEEASEGVIACGNRKAELEQFSVFSRLSDSLVIAATVDGCISRLSSDNLHPCHVFLDEAAYCPLIKGTTLLSYSAPLTFLGDHMQLPPVCEMPDNKFETDLYMPVFLWAQSALCVPDLFLKKPRQVYSDYKNELTFPFGFSAKFDLLHTFRFGESLARVLARFVYTPDFRGNKAISTDIFVINVPKSSSDVKNTNPAECAAVKRFLENNDPSDYAVLAPFKKQRALLSKHIASDNVFTIHGSQGREWHTVILSVTETTSHWFLKPRLINTAISRAKQQLVIVCDADYWKTQTNHIIGGLVSVAEEIR